MYWVCICGDKDAKCPLHDELLPYVLTTWPIKETPLPADMAKFVSENWHRYAD